jgi:ribose/xylose/arabinose/galactoside ABC-type transport system permease subunit
MQTVVVNRKRNSILSKVNNFVNAMGVWLVVVLFFVILSLTTDTFLSYANLINVVRQICVKRWLL